MIVEKVMTQAAKNERIPGNDYPGLEVSGLAKGWNYSEAVEEEVPRAARGEERNPDYAPPPGLKSAAWELSRNCFVVEGTMVRAVRLLESD